MEKKVIQLLLSDYKDMQQICFPLLLNTPITIVNFIRVSKTSNRAMYLCDNYDWLQNYFKHDFQNVGAFETNSQFWPQTNVLWNSLSDKDPIVITSREQFNIYTGITLINNTGDYVDFFNFGTDLHAGQEKILRILSVLDGFCKEFYHKAKRLIQTFPEKNIQIVPKKLKQEFSVPEVSKRLYLGPKYNYNYLTNKEKEIIYFLSKGFTSLDMANYLNCSYRTIEKHVENIKRKLGCKTQFEMGFVLNSLMPNIRGSAYSNIC